MKEILTSFRSLFTNRGGMALVLVLLAVTIITAMVVEFAYGVYTNTAALDNWQRSQKLSLTAKSASRLASRLLSASDYGTGGTQDPFLRDLFVGGVFQTSQKVPYGDIEGTITLRIEDENAKFNLNSLKSRDGYDFFVRLLRTLNLNTDIANLVSYWINSSTDNRPADFSVAKSKNAYLDSVDELLLIPGIDRGSYERLLPYVTIYGSGNDTFLINLNSADVPVIMSLSDNISRELAERVLSYRPLTSVQSVPGVGIGTFPGGHISYNGYAFHIVSTAESAGMKRIVECALEGTGRAKTVRYWKEM